MGLAPNEVLGDGRYQLLAQCGADEPAGMEFWHAWDVQHDRNIALTVLVGDPTDEVDVAWARHVLEGVRFAETAAHPALATVRYLPGPGHVAASHNGVLGLVVTEWTDGVDLLDVVRTGPLPVAAACRLLRPLVAAVDGAHHTGVVAGVDSPERIRVGDQGTAVLAFRGTRPDASTRDDVRGLGAVLYLLLTGAWPDLSGELVAPAELRDDVPRDLSLVAVLSVDGTRVPDIRTCGPLLRALDEVIEYDNADPTAIIDVPLVKTSTQVDAPIEVPALAAVDSAVDAPVETPVASTVARSRLGGRLIAVVAAMLAIAATVLVGAKVAGAFDVPKTTAALPGTSATQHPTTRTTTTPPPTTTTKPPAPPPPVVPTSVSEYLVLGSQDNPGQLGRVVDGDPGTMWPTDIYHQQFPAFIPGIGVLAGLPRPTKLASVTITSPSAGTVVEIHSAAAPDVPLAAAPLLATATLQANTTTIPLPAGAAATPYVLVWITQLADRGDGYQSVIAEITYQPAA